jgi:hypothetical protein
MRYRDPLKQISSRTRPYWNQDKTRPAVRRALNRLLQCRTPQLGGSIYASENQQKILYNTCKSSACPSCGHRATLQWERGWLAALPDLPYKGITFTMPHVLWEVFKENRPLARALSALAAKVIQAWARAKYGVRVGILAILHTFNGRLEFNSHVHTMVSGGGLHSSGSWIAGVFYDRDKLMRSWRRALIKFLRTALRAGVLKTELKVDQLEDLLDHLERCWWSIRIQSFKSKEHFLRYAGRYVRRPPIAQRRINSIGEGSVTFWTKDKRLGERIEVRCTLETFIDRWAQHIPERYQHAARAFGLFASRSLAQTSSAMFAVLRQKRRRRPGPLPWAVLMKRDFGKDPLLDCQNQKMKWVRGFSPSTST